MKPGIDKYKVIYTIGFIFFCVPVGQLVAVLITSLFLGTTTSHIAEVVNNPGTTDHSSILLLAFFNSFFSYFIIPTVYLLLTNRSLVNSLRPNKEIHLLTFILAIVSILTIGPFISMVIKLNYSIEFPDYLSELEAYIKASEEKRRRMTNVLLAFREPKDSIAILIVMAIGPGFFEEIFFRGYVQKQLEYVFRNHHYAILFASFLFSLLHFHFYGFLPRLILGMLIGYIFMWSRNIWYPIAAHITNNVVVVLSYDHSEVNNHDPENEWLSLALLSTFSLLITVFIVYFLRKKLLPKFTN